MICISITNSSNRFAVVDMYNAAPQCDLMEIRLDRLEQPDITLLLESRQKPILVSCRRPQDGGEWSGTEEQRQVLLRQAMFEGVDYVELEVDIAEKIPRYGETKRVISYTSLNKPVRDLQKQYERACALDADIVKFTAPTNTLEEAWPMLRVLNRPEVPCVAEGIGQPGLTLSILGRKLNSPWTYAALEEGMEAHPGQATVAQLRDVYHYSSIESKTQLIGVSGFTPQQQLAICLINGALKHLELNTRCLPMGIGEITNFDKLMKALHVTGVVLDVEYRSLILQVVEKLEESAQTCRQADLVLHQKKEWHGFNTVWRSAVRTLESTLKEKTGGESQPLRDRTVLIGGADATARAIAYGIQKRGGLLVVTSHDEDRATLLAQMYECRFVPQTHLNNVYADCVVCIEDDIVNEDPDVPPKQLIDEYYLRRSHTVMDLRNIPEDTPLLKEARLKKATIVEPLQIFIEQLSQQIRGLTGKSVSAEEMTQWLGS